MTLQQLIDQAVSVASRGQESSLSPALSAEMIGEDLLGIVFHKVAVDAARNHRLRTLLRRTKQLSVVDGVVALSGDVLTAYICESVLVDPADVNKVYSLEPWHVMRAGQMDLRLGHYAIEGESALHVVEPDTAYDPTSGPTIDLEITMPCVPLVPATAGGTIDVIDEIADTLVEELAAALQPMARTK